MNKSLLLAVAAAAMAFTVSCSSDGGLEGGGGSSNLSDLPKEVYFYSGDGNRGEKYEGNADIFVHLSKYTGYSCSGDVCECRRDGVASPCSREEASKYDSLPAGKIQNGQVLLDLPENVGKYLSKMEQPCDGTYEEGETCQSTFSFSKTLTYTTPEGGDHIYAYNIAGRAYCRLQLLLVISGVVDEQGIMFYFSESGKAVGTITGTYTDNGETRTWKTNYDWNYSKGWNVVYRYRNDVGGRSYTTDLSKTGATLEWWLTRCRD